MNVDTVEFVLGFKRVLDVDFDEDPRDQLKIFNQTISHKGTTKKKDKDRSDSEDEDDREYTSNQMFRYRHKRA